MSNLIKIPSETLLQMIDALERTFNCRVTSLYTDHGGGYHSKKFLSALITRGITAQPSVLRHREMNPVAEATNCIIIIMDRIAHIASGLLQNHLNEAVIPFCLH